MNEITIAYRPVRILPWTKKIETTHPAKWDELSPAQLIAVACVYKGTMTDDGLISAMLSIPRRFVRRMAPYHKLKIIELIEFIKDVKPYNEFIIEKIGSYRAPKAKLKDETFGTFIFAESYFSRYNEKSDPEDLNRFVACWYRTGKFEEKELEKNALYISAHDLAKREAIFINYQLIREYLVATYPYVFRTNSETTEREEKTTWVDVFDAFVGDDLKDQDKYADLPISAVLRHLDKRIQKNLEHES